MAETLTSQDRLYPINFVQVLSVVRCERTLQIESERKNSMNDYLI